MSTTAKQCKAKWLRYGIVNTCDRRTRAKDGVCPGHKHVRPLKVQVREWRGAIREVDRMMGRLER